MQRSTPHLARAGLRRALGLRVAQTAAKRRAWRCGWCSRDLAGWPASPSAAETTGICDACLRERRGVGARHVGPGFVVWDEDAASATRWASELRAAVACDRQDAAS
jgi:hypothetical protein